MCDCKAELILSGIVLHYINSQKENDRSIYPCQYTEIEADNSLRVINKFKSLSEEELEEEILKEI